MILNKIKKILKNTKKCNINYKMKHVKFHKLCNLKFNNNNNKNNKRKNKNNNNSNNNLLFLKV